MATKTKLLAEINKSGAGGTATKLSRAARGHSVVG
jgi:hypothetical protein